MPEQTHLSAAQEAATEVSPKRGSLGWGSSSDDDGNYQCSSCSGQRLIKPSPSCSSLPSPPPDDRAPTTLLVSLPPGFQSPPVSDADSTLTGFRAVDCPLRLRVDDASACYRQDDRDWMDAWRVQQSCLASGHTTPSSHLYADQESALEFFVRTRLSARTSGIDVRQTSYRFFPGILALREDLTRTCWPRTSMARGMLSAYKGEQASSPTVPWRRTST